MRAVPETAVDKVASAPQTRVENLIVIAVDLRSDGHLQVGGYGRVNRQIESWSGRLNMPLAIVSRAEDAAVTKLSRDRGHHTSHASTLR